MNPISDHGNSTDEKRCAVVRKNGSVCNKRIVGDVCEGNHFQKGNEKRGISNRRVLEQEAEQWIIPTRDRLLRDAGWTSVESAPRKDVLYWTMVAQVYRLLDHATRKGRVAEASQLLQRLSTLLGMSDQFHAPVSQGDRLAGELQAMTNSELTAYVRRLADEVDALEGRAALPNNASSATLPSLQTQPNPPTRNIGVAPDGRASSPEPFSSTVPQARGLTFSEPPDLDPSPESVASSRPASAVPPAVSRPPVSSEPPLPTRTRYGRNFGETEVRKVMADSGDLVAYETGAISRHEAYRRTRAFLEQLAEISKRRS